MRRRPEAIAALVNGLLVWLLPVGISALFTIGEGLGIGASDTGITVHADGWTPWNPVMATAQKFGVVMLPFAVVAAWRTWVHARRRLELGSSGWQGVRDAGACGLVAVLVVMTPGILTHPAQSIPYVIGLGAYAVIFGLLIGLLLRASALIVLKLTEPQKQIKFVGTT